MFVHIRDKFELNIFSANAGKCITMNIVYSVNAWQWNNEAGVEKSGRQKEIWTEKLQLNCNWFHLLYSGDKEGK